jgi:hypothetical protein
LARLTGILRLNPSLSQLISLSDSQIKADGSKDWRRPLAIQLQHIIRGYLVHHQPFIRF